MILLSVFSTLQFRYGMRSPIRIWYQTLQVGLV